VDVTPIIHQALKDKELLPKEHLTDTNYAESKQFVASQLDYGIDLIAPTRADNKWQGRAKQGFDASSFQLDWQAQKATCPTGHESSSWTPALDRRDNEVIKIKYFDQGLSDLLLPFSVYSNRPTNHYREERGSSCGLL
jgi:transposase